MIVSIVDVARQFTKVWQRRNHKWVGYCPFHEDTTHPNLSLDNEKGLWYCFACAEGGNTVQFIMKAKKLAFADAMAWLNGDKTLKKTKYVPRYDERRYWKKLDDYLFLQLCLVNKLLDKEPTNPEYISLKQQIWNLLEEKDDIRASLEYTSKQLKQKYGI